jgi:hypothetical protein
MADEGFKSKLAPILSAAIHNLVLKYLRSIVDSPKDNIQPNPYDTNGGDMRLDSTNRRISSRCLLLNLLSLFFSTVIRVACSFESQKSQYEIFLPAGGKGAIVVAVSRSVFGRTAWTLNHCVPACRNFFWTSEVDWSRTF